MELENSGQKKEFYSSILGLYLSRFIAQIAFFVIRYILIVNWVPKETYADAIIYYRFLDVLFSFLLFGPMIIPRIMGDKSIKFNDLFKNALFLLVINIVIIILILFIWIHIIPIQITQNLDFFLIWLILGFTISTFDKYFEFYFLGMKYIKIIFFASLIYAIVYIITAYIFILVLGTGFLGIVLSYCACNLCSVIFDLIIWKLNWEKVKGGKLSKSLNKQILLYALPIVLSAFFYFLNFRVNSFFLRVYNIDTFIYYDTSISLILYFITFVSVPIQDAIFPYISQQILLQNTSEIKKIFQITVRMNTLFVMAAILILYLFISPILTIFYPIYVSPNFITIMRILLCGSFFYATNQLYGRISAAGQKSFTILIGQIIGAIVNIIGLIFFEIYQEILIILMIFGVSCLIMTIYYTHYVKKLIDIKFWETYIIQQVISFYIPIVLILFFDSLSFPLWALVTGAISVYLILIKLLKLFELNDLHVFISLIRIKRP